MSRRNNRERERGEINKLDIMRKEMERIQKEEIRKEEMERLQREKELSAAVNRGLPANRGRGPGRWNTVGERLDMLASREGPVPEYVAGPALAVAPAVALELSEEQRVREHMNYMENLRRRRPRYPPQYTDPSEYYENYYVTDMARNFPENHNYTEPAAERPVITLSPGAQAYEESQQKLADKLESLERGWGGGRKKRSTRTRQKKQRRHRHRRRSTKKYRK
jgi:hypothetical protein